MFPHIFLNKIFQIVITIYFFTVDNKIFKEFIEIHLSIMNWELIFYSQLNFWYEYQVLLWKVLGNKAIVLKKLSNQEINSKKYQCNKLSLFNVNMKWTFLWYVQLTANMNIHKKLSCTISTKNLISIDNLRIFRILSF